VAATTLWSKVRHSIFPTSLVSHDNCDGDPCEPTWPRTTKHQPQLLSYEWPNGPQHGGPPESTGFWPGPSTARPVYHRARMARPVYRARAWAATQARRAARPDTKIAGGPGGRPLISTPIYNQPPNPQTLGALALPHTSALHPSCFPLPTPTPTSPDLPKSPSPSPLLAAPSKQASRAAPRQRPAYPARGGGGLRPACRACGPFLYLFQKVIDRGTN
jgi:hypothetical protein